MRGSAPRAFAAIGGVYEGLGREYPPATREAIASYARSKPRGSHGVHRYSLEGMGLDAGVERERFRFYLDQHDIPREGARSP